MSALLARCEHGPRPPAFCWGYVNSFNGQELITFDLLLSRTEEPQGDLLDCSTYLGWSVSTISKQNAGSLKSLEAVT